MGASGAAATAARCVAGRSSRSSVGETGSAIAGVDDEPSSVGVDDSDPDGVGFFERGASFHPLSLHVRLCGSAELFDVCPRELHDLTSTVPGLMRTAPCATTSGASTLRVIGPILPRFG